MLIPKFMDLEECVRKELLKPPMSSEKFSVLFSSYNEFYIPLLFVHYSWPEFQISCKFALLVSLLKIIEIFFFSPGASFQISSYLEFFAGKFDHFIFVTHEREIETSVAAMFAECEGYVGKFAALVALSRVVWELHMIRVCFRTFFY
jgi:hypothetical protein